MEVASDNEFEGVSGEVRREGFQALSGERDHGPRARAGEREAQTGERALEVVEHLIGADFFRRRAAEFFCAHAAQVAGDGEDEKPRGVVVGASDKVTGAKLRAEQERERGGRDDDEISGGAVEAAVAGGLDSFELGERGRGAEGFEQGGFKFSKFHR